jgi:protoporphyrinogen oxidase
MKIGIIGAGFTGLSAAYELQQQGHDITVIEKDAQPGGLALGFKEKNWDWTLEQHYHHWFTNDTAVLNLAKHIHHPVLIRRPKTSVFIEESTYQLDSPGNVLRFEKLSPFDRLRMAATLGFLKFDPFWKPLEKIHAATFLPKAMGKTAYEMLWEPQFMNKFGDHTSDISLAWFWARIKKRTSSLAYPEKGFLAFAQDLTQTLQNNNVETLFQTQITSLESKNKRVRILTDNKKYKDLEFDNVIVTLPSFIFLKVAQGLPSSYVKRLSPLQGLGAINVVLRLSRPLLSDKTYWLSICEKNAPVTAVVEHTNFMDKKYYNNEHIVYLGNYLPATHPYFGQTAQQLIATFDPLLKKLNPSYKKNLIGAQIFKAPFAQPIIPVNYSRMIPPFETPLKNVFLANMQQVYPWDRGTNYAVELGQRIASRVSRNT